LVLHDRTKRRWRQARLGDMIAQDFGRDGSNALFGLQGGFATALACGARIARRYQYDCPVAPFRQAYTAQSGSD